MTATFFVATPPHGAEAEVAPANHPKVAPRQPDVPVVSKKVDRAIRRDAKKLPRKVVPRGPEDKTLRMTIPKMARIRNDTIPYAPSGDDKAFHDHAGVHLRGTGNPWDRQANVYIAGHRLGYPATNSWLAFWDLNVLHKGDRIFIRDAAGKRYVYRVFRVFIVPPSRVSVTRPLKGRNILSLQTCTLPDYSKRLIVQANKVS